MKKKYEEVDMSRRHFVEIAGGVAGVAALVSMGVPMGWAANDTKIVISKVGYKLNEADILVLGSGMAGLFAAVKGHDAGAKVLMVSKGRLGSSGQTPFAKGIFAYDPKTAGMTLDEFTDAVSRSALGTNNPVYTRQMAEHSLARVNELKEWGFFESPLYFNAFKYQSISSAGIKIFRFC